MLSEKDKAQLQAKGISESQLLHQLQQLKEGFPYLRIHAAASVEKGIMQASDEAMAQYQKAWEEYTADSSHKVVKFVPASGAASRMFKDLFAYVDSDHDAPESKFEQTFFEHLHEAPYLEVLDAACQRLYGMGIDALCAAGRQKDVVRALLGDEGLAYGRKPKGVLLFHRYAEGNRTPVEEHLVEGALYARGADGIVHLHFTVSPEHRDLFTALVREKVPALEKQFGVSYDISFSEQKSSTDTIASTPEGEPFRQADGSLLFRPGGHGALIENLGDIDADVIFIKNIDNVVHDRCKEPTILYKRLLAGILVSVQKQVFAYLERLESGNYNMDTLREMLQFVQKTLCTKNPETKMLEDTELAIYLQRKLNRPIRVCGMVRNEGEAGGGPFLAYNPDSTISPQILESSQIDMNDPEKRALFEKGTHFNPVDLVCATRDYKHQPFDLKKYVDPATGFISQKSKDGKELKALELPGLWNGAMSDWNTIFVEVPLATFNPVKTVNDLYRPAHLG